MSRCEENVYINTSQTRPASESSGNVLCFMMDTLEHSTRNPTVVFKTSGTEETKNHLTVTKMASNVLLIKGKPEKTQKNGLWVQDFRWVFSQFINHVPFIGECSKKPQMEQKEKGQRDEM